MDDVDAKSSSLWSFIGSEDLLYLSDRGTSGPPKDRKYIQEAMFLSKAFAQSMHPTKIIPFYYKASAAIDEHDVTITTLVTSNRYKVLRQLVERYQGPVSVTIYVQLPSHEFESPSATATRHFITALKELEALYMSSPLFATYVDVHLALSPLSGSGTGSGSILPRDSQTSTGMTPSTPEGARQFNVWRNIARLFARTEFVMMLDVDFAVCTDWRSAIRSAMHNSQNKDISVKAPRFGVRIDDPTRIHERNGSLNGSQHLTDTEVMQKLKDGKIALVVPAFEYVRQEDGTDQSTFPQSKESLVQLTSGAKPKITTFHASWAPGHNSTEYPKYFSIPPGAEQVYKVTQYQSAYEPYVIMSKRVTWCDERFTGYGGNKAACLFELYLSGVTFYVMSDHFLIHQSHTYEEEARREEVISRAADVRKYNRKLYADFKEEACLRYLYRFKKTGVLGTLMAANALEECKKIKNVVKIASEFLGEGFDFGSH
ncbi:glycosyl-transferase for dystroglycan-domain-containing protein [Irpex rosettiformis]|uniref:Glycosyl-transferase for dystroglycan-domain-containing protein n=1 Tax=Irpex rosettiformis TaxID=378272 RepID=A0ACB8U1Q4_9APHY|nr:glycosyl-transferase for dystroglycan-domain-containing protein [Irpex rosettiformis]